MAVIFDNLAAGLASAVFIAFICIDIHTFYGCAVCDFSSLMTLIPKVMAIRPIVDSMGYPFFFTFTFAIGIPILALIYFVDKHIVIGDNDDIYDNDDDNP